jgi:hypothetical protein
VLDTYGSLRDLANAGVVLSIGLPLVAVDSSDEFEDLEGHGTAQYDELNQWWVVEFDESGVRYVPTQHRPEVTQFLCVKCRTELPNSPQATFSPSASCGTCGASVLLPLQRPEAVA